MHPPSINISPRPRPKRLLLPIRLLGIPERHLASDDQMRGQASVRVRRVVGVATGASVSQSL